MITKLRELGPERDDRRPQKLEQQNLAQELGSEQDDGLSRNLGQTWEQQKLDSEQADGWSQHVEQKVARRLGAQLIDESQHRVSWASCGSQIGQTMQTNHTKHWKSPRILEYNTRASKAGPRAQCAAVKHERRA